MSIVKIVELWDTGIEILSFDEFNRPTCIADLKKCNNVIVGEKAFKGGFTELLIDERLVLVSPAKKVHRSSGGSFHCLEVF